MKIVLGNKTALLFGASGLVGSACLDALLGCGIYDKIIIFGRQKIGISNPKVEEHIIDFERLGNFTHLIKGDDLFCCLGSTLRKAGSKDAFKRIDYFYPLQIAKAATFNGVKQFILVSAIDADVNSRFFYNQVKGQLESDLQKIPFRAIRIVRPSLLLGKRTGEWRAAEFLATKLSFLIAPFLGKYKPVSAKTVARAMVVAAQSTEVGTHIYESAELGNLAKTDISVI